MAASRRLVPIVTVVLLLAAAFITVALLSRGPAGGRNVTARPSAAAPTVPTLVGPIENAPTPGEPYYPRDLLQGNGSRIVASAAELEAPGQQVVVLTLASTGRTTNQVLVWQEGENVNTQVFEVVDKPDLLFGGFQSSNAAVIQVVEQDLAGRRELGVVYDATAYGSGSPTAHFALLRLEGRSWRIVWDAAGNPLWRGGHGRIELPNGDLSELVVHADSFSERADEVPGVLFEANAGPHRQFVDTWVRGGDAYTRRSAVTVPSAYATLDEFLYYLSTGDDDNARARVTDSHLLQTARDAGLDAGIGKNWMISCDVCTQAGPIGFYSGPPVQVFFEQRNGAWLISDIEPAPTSTP